MFDENFKPESCTIEGNISMFNRIVKPIKDNWLGEKISVYRYFESIIRFYGSLPCAICNSENGMYFDEIEKKGFQVYSSALNCLDDVYNLELSLRLVNFLQNLILYLDNTLCLLKGNPYKQLT